MAPNPAPCGGLSGIVQIAAVGDKIDTAGGGHRGMADPVKRKSLAEVEKMKMPEAPAPFPSFAAPHGDLTIVHVRGPDMNDGGALLAAGSSGGGCGGAERPRLGWTPQLHKHFIDAVAHLVIKNVVPKTIMQQMSIDGLTRENVASHLQKYPLYLKRMQGLNSGGGGGGGGGGGTWGSHSSGSATDAATEHLFTTGPGPGHHSPAAITDTYPTPFSPMGHRHHQAPQIGNFHNHPAAARPLGHYGGAGAGFAQSGFLSRVAAPPIVGPPGMHHHRMVGNGARMGMMAPSFLYRLIAPPRLLPG